MRQLPTIKTQLLPQHIRGYIIDINKSLPEFIQFNCKGKHTTYYINNKPILLIN